MKIRYFIPLFLFMIGCVTSKSNMQSVTLKDNSTPSEPQFFRMDTSAAQKSNDSAMMKQFGFSKPTQQKGLSKAVDTTSAAPANKKSEKDPFFPENPKK